MQKRDVSDAFNWPANAWNFLEMRCNSSEAASYTDPDADIMEFLHLLTEHSYSSNIFSANYRLVSNILSPDQYTSMREWFTTSHQQFGDAFLKTLLYMLCDRQHAVLVNIALWYGCYLHKAVRNYNPSFSLITLSSVACLERRLVG